jgi:Mg2+ and Co2+ transporter CorA
MGVYSGNRTLLGESAIGSDHIMDLVLENERNDLNMFNAVINCDFVEAFSEAGLTMLDEETQGAAKEETKKSIGKKIKELFKKAYDSIRRFVSAFIAKIKNLVSNDAKLYKQYHKNFSDNAEGYKIESWKPLLEGDTFDNFWSNYNKHYTDAIDALQSAADGEAMSKIVKDAKDAAKEIDIADIIEKAYFGDRKAVENHPLDSKEVRTILNVVGSSTRSITEIKRAGEATINTLKKKEADLKYMKDVQDNSDVALARINAKYKLASTFVTYASKTLNAHCNTYARYLAACRRAFVLVGKKATSKAEQGTSESALMDAMLTEASNDYVESMLLSL